MPNDSSEIMAETPTPFCCPAVAGARVLHLHFTGDGPVPGWHAIAKSPMFGGVPVPVRHCPFCGTVLPGLVLRKDPPSPICSPDRGGHCLTCEGRLGECRCFSPDCAWEPEGAPPVFAAVFLLKRLIPRLRCQVPVWRFLSVSRKGRPAEKGLPGGRLEPGETPEQAARRELFEETGYVAGPAVKAIDAIDDSGVRVVAFTAEDFSEMGRPPSASETGVVEWVSMSDLVDSSPFSSFNRALFSLLEIRC